MAQESYNNLIDLCIALEENPELAGNTTELFRRILSDYFFEKETGQSKNFEIYFHEFPVPAFISGESNILAIDQESLRSYVQGTMVNNSLAGTIMLSTSYLKSFYQHHAPSFGKLPEDIQFDLLDKVKRKNELIITAFEKMGADRDADMVRKVITLVALILKNIHLRTGRPFADLKKSAEEIISATFRKSDEIFKGTPVQMADLRDDSKIKELIKAFFRIKQFKEITEIADLYKQELERYRKRSMKAFA